MSKQTLIKLNEQFHFELVSSYLYLEMSYYFKSNSLDGFAHWMMRQSDEERIHAMKIYEFILLRQGNVCFEPITGSNITWKSTLDVLELAYKNEKDVTQAIHNIVDLSLQEKDYATFNFLQWFVEEQVEEENSSLSLLEQVQFLGESPNALYLLDKDLGKR